MKKQLTLEELLTSSHRGTRGIPNLTIRPFCFNRTYLDKTLKLCPRNWYVHRRLTHYRVPIPQALRYGRHLTVLGFLQNLCLRLSEQNTYLVFVLKGCMFHCPVSLSQSANFSAPSRNTRTLMLGFLSPLSGWVNNQDNCTIICFQN